MEIRNLLILVLLMVIVPLLIGTIWLVWYKLTIK